AFSLARLYGLVVDRAQLDVIRRPSREPDAPAERALSSWIAELPSYSQGPTHPSPHGQGPGLLIEATAAGSDFDTTRQGSKGEGETGNGAPSGPVTGTPNPRAHSAPMAEIPPVGRREANELRHPGRGGEAESGSPLDDEGTTYPSAEDLF